MIQTQRGKRQPFFDNLHICLRLLPLQTLLLVSLFLYSGAVYHDSCDCPEPSGALWEKDMHCPATFAQIESDLSVFPSVDPDRNAHEIPQRFEKRHSLCHYTIKNNQVQPHKKKLFCCCTLLVYVLCDRLYNVFYIILLLSNACVFTFRFI